MTPPGELPVSDDERVITFRCGPEAVVYGVFALVLDPFGAKRAESCGVGPALGREVAAEAEHVCPADQAQAAEFRELPKAETLGDEASGVLADGKVGDPVGACDPAVDSPGAFGGLGRVLGHVRGDLAVSYVPGRGDGPNVMFTPPDQGPRREACGDWSLEVDGVGGLGDSGGEQVEGGPGGRGRAGSGGAVEPDDGVEVDHAGRWYSATFAKETRSWAARALSVIPVRRASVRRKVMVNRRHSSGAQALNRTEPV
jgi:hypothetical protein